MTNYVENILTKDEEHIYTVDIPKDVENIKVDARVSPRIIRGLKEQFPYEGNFNANDYMKGIIRLHKTPQNEWDKREQHLNEAKRHVKIANEMVPYHIPTSLKDLEKEYKKDLPQKSETKSGISDWIWIGAISISCGVGVGSIIQWLYKLIF